MVDWKKEVKLSDLVGGKKKQKDAAAPEAVEAVVEADKSEQTSIWKKELSFGRKKQPKAEPVEDTPEVEEQTLELDAPAAVELVQHYAPEPSRPSRTSSSFPSRSSRSSRSRSRTSSPTRTFSSSTCWPRRCPRLHRVAEPGPSHRACPRARTGCRAAQSLPSPRPPLRRPPRRSSSTRPCPQHSCLRFPTSPSLRSRRRSRRKPRRRSALPFYKRDLSFGRKSKSAPEFELDDAEPKAKKLKRKSRSLSIPRPAPRAGRGGKHPKRLVGLKIGASQLAAATVSNNGHAEVLQLARGPLDAGIVSNGELREPELLAEALKEFFKQNKLPKRGVRLGIATNRIGVRTLEIPGIQDAKQLANAIKFRAQEALPIPIDEAVLDYQVLSETTNEEGEISRRILLVLAYRDLIDRYVDACKKAGIQLVGIDLEAFALLRAIAAPRDEGTPAQAALVGVTVGHDRTTFAVSDGRTCEFTRVLDWGGHSLNVGLARALDMAPSEVDHFKRALSLTGNEVPEGLTGEQAVKARAALNGQVQSFARELVSSLQFYQNQPGSLGIGEIVLTGGTAHLAGFVEELARLIGVRVRVGDPLVRVKISKKLREPEQLGSLAVAIGLGIED